MHCLYNQLDDDQAPRHIQSRHRQSSSRDTRLHRGPHVRIAALSIVYTRDSHVRAERRSLGWMMAPFARVFLLCGAGFALAAVALGAFGAHALKDRIGPDLLAIYRTGVEYHFYHALGLLAVGLLANAIPESNALKWSGALMIAGIVLFSGSLYLLSVTGMRWLGAVTPFGGVAFIAAWGSMFAAVLMQR